MLRENTVFAKKIIEYYSERGTACTVVDEHLSLLVTLCEEGETHEFRCGRRAFAGGHVGRKFYRMLESELARLKAALAPAAAERQGRQEACSRHYGAARPY